MEWVWPPQTSGQMEQPLVNELLVTGPQAGGLQFVAKQLKHCNHRLKERGVYPSADVAQKVLRAVAT